MGFSYSFVHFKLILLPFSYSLAYFNLILWPILNLLFGPFFNSLAHFTLILWPKKVRNFSISHQKIRYFGEFSNLFYQSPKKRFEIFQSVTKKLGILVSF